MNNPKNFYRIVVTRGSTTITHDCDDLLDGAKFCATFVKPLKELCPIADESSFMKGYHITTDVAGQQYAEEILSASLDKNNPEVVYGSYVPVIKGGSSWKIEE
jgi:hypothetical protein